MKRALFLIDSSALAYRSFYAFINNPLINSRGEQTSAVYGYAAQILRIIQDESPSHMAIVQDLKAPTFRHNIFPDYKANRKPMPEELQKQFPVIDDFITASGIPCISKEGFEADDIIGTLAVQARDKGLEVLMVTRDKDMMQLVSDKVRLFEPGRRNQPHSTKGPKEVMEKFGVAPEKMIDLQALMGDSSDNIPGVEKVGPKTAAGLLNEFGTLENIYENVDNITRKALKENLKRCKDKAFLSRDLVRLNCDVEIDYTVDDLVYKPMDADKVGRFLERWELNSLKSYFPPPSEHYQVQPVKPQIKGNYRLADKESLKKDFLNEIQKADVIAMDTETTGLDPLTAELVGLCVSTSEFTGWYIPFGHAEGTNLNYETAVEQMSDVLRDPSKKFIFHNAKFDLPILERYGLAPNAVPGHLIDTMVAGHLLNPGARGLSLDVLSEKYLGYSMIPIESLIGKKGKNQLTFDKVPVEDACRYGAEDADVTLRLWNILKTGLEKENLIDVFFNLEMPLVLVLQKMEQRGVSLDTAELSALFSTMEADIARLKTEIYQHAAEEFNIESTQQLGRILFDKLGLKKGKKTKTGFSTDVNVLKKLQGSHPIIDTLLEFRETVKLHNTYVSVLPTLIKDRTGRVHTSYSQTITATGRLSSLSPNLQNIPIRTPAGKKIRASFIAGNKNYVLLAADYSQIELRILAHLSQDQALVKAYREGQDIHSLTASFIYGVDESEVTSDQRRDAKVVNFGILYGMGPRRLSRDLGISGDKASEFIENYFNRYSGINEFISKTVDGARKDGYVKTISGRKRYLPELASSNRMLQENAKRMAVNTPIQGSAADLIKKAMLALDWKLGTAGLDCDMLLQVHDELVFEVAVNDVDKASALIKSTMESAMSLMVPLEVDIGTGNNWLEAHG